MITLINGQERTFLHLERLAAVAGWKAVRVHGLGLDVEGLELAEFRKAPLKRESRIVP